MRLTTFAQGVILALASAALSAVQYPLYKGALSGGLSNVTTALLESAFTIAGATTIPEFQRAVRFIPVSDATRRENGAHSIELVTHANRTF